MTETDSSWLHLWDFLAAFGFVLVIAGVILEGIEHFPWFRKEERFSKHVEKVGWLVLVFGLALEFLAENRSKRITDADNARLNREAGDAGKSAGSALERAQILQKENLILQQRVIELRQKFAWRQVAEPFREYLTRRTKGKAEIVYKKDDSEAYSFAQSIFQEMQAAGWTFAANPKAKDSEGYTTFMLAEAGIMTSDLPDLAIVASVLDFRSTKVTPGDLLSDILDKAFRACGIIPNVVVPYEQIRPTPGTIKIVVGSRF